MASMTKTPSYWAQAEQMRWDKMEAKALKRKKLLRIVLRKDLEHFLSAGWVIVSHAHTSAAVGQHWFLRKGSQ